MKRQILVLGLAASLVAWSVPSEAQRARQRGHEVRATGSVEQVPVRGGRAPDRYTYPPSAQGPITATTPNQWGNLGGPSTGGGGGGGP